MTVDVFVRPPATPGELPGGDGSAANPFHSVQKGITEADAHGGGNVHLFGGHFVEPVKLSNIGNPDHPILVRPVDGGGEVFIEACLPEFLPPQPTDPWQPAAGGAPGEFESVSHFDKLVNLGAFYDEPAHTRLVSYAEVDDLRSNNQRWPDDEGNVVWKLKPGTTDIFIPGDKRRPFVYMGPGIWFDERPGERRIHLRLAPTTNNIPDWPDFDPAESDPNRLRLALSAANSHAIFLKFCHNIQFQNLTLRFGNPDTVRLNSCSDIVFDHCRIRSGSRAIFLPTEDGRKNENIRIEHCEVDGGLPTWFFRSDRKDTYLRGPDGQPEATKAELHEYKLGYATSGVQISGDAGCVGVVVHHCEIVNAHDSYVFGYGMEFHHNWVHNLNDDGIALSAVAETSEAKIYCNVLTQCLTALSFASNTAVGPVYIYGNLIDLRQPTLSKRPPAAGASDSLKQGHFFKDGANEGPIDLFHNTLLVRDPGLLGDDLDDANRVGFAYFSTIGLSESRTAFNNIMVAVFTPGAVKPIAFLAPKNFQTETDGNTFFRIPQNDPTHQFEVRYKNVTVEARNFADLKEYRQHYWPPDGIGGYEENSRVEDPGFTSFDSANGTPLADDDLRLDPTIDTADAVELSAKLRSMYVAATGTDPANRGCYPSTGTPLRVGVDGRRVFPPT
jgi:hypothetical protein